MAECHPVGFQWVMEAKARGATIIHVDPRFTRTSAMADIHVPIRAGTDIAFLGGIVNYILEHDRAFKEYVVAYTNASAILREDFRDTEDLDGVFSGWDRKTATYDETSWQYEGIDGEVPAAGHKEIVPSGSKNEVRGKKAKEIPRDPTLQHPRCVYQILKKHYARYTPQMVADICGITPDLVVRVAEELCSNSGRERTGAFCYAVGWTQHTVGVQYIRTAAIIQLLLGNVGRPGGGIMALRGHASIQGSTDIPTLFNLLPGYLPMPHAEHDEFKEYLNTNTAGIGFWSKFEAYFVSLMKAWFGDAVSGENDWGFHWLPAITGDHSHMTTVAEMVDGHVKGYFVMGENPAVGSMNGALQRKGLQKLDWLVVRDFQVTETADFWRSAPEIESGEVSPKDIDTEVFFFPAASHIEKDGSFQHAASLTMAPQGDRAARRLSQRARFHLPPRRASQGALRRIAREARRAHQAAHLELSGEGCASRGRQRGGAGGDQRMVRRRSPSALGLHGAQGRRLDGLRVLDLLRLPQGRREPDGAPQAGPRAGLGGEGVGVGVARQPAHPLQPRLRRS